MSEYKFYLEYIEKHEILLGTVSSDNKQVIGDKSIYYLKDKDLLMEVYLWDNSLNRSTPPEKLSRLFCVNDPTDIEYRKKFNIPIPKEWNVEVQNADKYDMYETIEPKENNIITTGMFSKYGFSNGIGKDLFYKLTE